MRAALLVLLPILLAAGRAMAGPDGVQWESDLQAGIERAAREGRPLLFAVNALENESANNMLATQAYRSASWGEATRGYVSFVCNPRTHGQGPGACTRYPGHTCMAHAGALTWFLARFGDELISPQHVILEPDGLVAYRKEYYTGVVGPALLETWLSRLAPSIAFSRAAIGRKARIDALGKTPLEELDAAADLWLDGSDGLAAAGIANALEETYDPKRRLALIAALRHAPVAQVPVLTLMAEDRVFYPEDEYAETLAWIRALFSADRPGGVWAATRALVRLTEPERRADVLRIWSGSEKTGIDDLPASERAHAYEALLLAADGRARRARPPASWTRGREAEIRRAQREGGRTTPGGVALADALTAGTPKRLRPALLQAAPEEVTANRAAVLAAMLGAPQARVRIAAALALLRARVSEQGAVTTRTILAALADPIEGRETRRHAIGILGDVPGQREAAWVAALEARLAGGDR